MACTGLACIGDGGCLEAMTNGANGTVMTLVGGVPTWSASTVFTADSGVGAPLAAINDPVIWTDTATGDVYLRDTAGNVTLIMDSFSFDVTSGPDATTVTDGPDTVENGDTLHFHSTGSIGFTVTPGSARVQIEGYSLTDDTLAGFTVKNPAGTTLGSVSKKPSATVVSIPNAAFADPLNPTQTEVNTWVTANGPLAPGTVLSVAGAGTVDDPDYAYVVNGAGTAVNTESPVSQQLPVAIIARTSKVGLTATFSGTRSAGIPTLTYAWTAAALDGGTGTVTFATAAASSTTATFSAIGRYRITLTITDGEGQSKATTHDIKVDRILEVNGIDDDINGFATLQEAFDWITANDNAQVANYLIEVRKTPADTARIIPNTARVKISARATIPFGVDFPAGSFVWAGEGNQSVISSTAGAAITGITGTSIRLESIAIQSSDATASIISTTGGSVNMTLCQVSGAANDITLTNTNCTLRNCFLSCTLAMTSAAANNVLRISGGEIISTNQGIAVSLTGITGVIVGAFISSTNFSALLFRNVSGSVSSCVIACSGASTAVDFPLLDVDSPVASTQILYISGNLCYHLGAGTSTQSSIVKLVPGGVGLLRVMHNQLLGNKYGFHAVGSPTGSVRITNNEIEGPTAALHSSSDATGATALAWANADIVGNTIKGPVTNVTFAAATDLGQGNWQY